MSVPLPDINLPYSRNLLNQVKLGKGVALKQLRDELAARPDIKRMYEGERATELANLKQRERMMWVKDANSRVRRVKSDFRDACTYTNPMGTRIIPDKKFVEKSKAKHAFNRPPTPTGTLC